MWREVSGDGNLVNWVCCKGIIKWNHSLGYLLKPCSCVEEKSGSIGADLGRRDDLDPCG